MISQLILSSVTFMVSTSGSAGLSHLSSQVPCGLAELSLFRPAQILYGLVGLDKISPQVPSGLAGFSHFSPRYPVDWWESVLVVRKYPEGWRGSGLLAPRYPVDWWDSVIPTPRYAVDCIMILLFLYL